MTFRPVDPVVIFTRRNRRCNISTNRSLNCRHEEIPRNNNNNNNSMGTISQAEDLHAVTPMQV